MARPPKYRHSETDIMVEALRLAIPLMETRTLRTKALGGRTHERDQAVTQAVRRHAGRDGKMLEDMRTLYRALCGKPLI
jgi:hypothetical protein